MLVIVGLVLSNFCYQGLQPDPDWALAFERSFFQVVAIACYIWGEIHFTKKDS